MPSKEDALNVKDIPIEQIAELEGFNPRTTTAIEDHLKLVDSIRAIGVQQPPIVRPEGDGFKLVAGHRRFKAAVDAGLKSVPCVIREDSLEDALVISVAENVNRADLDPVDVAGAFKRMRDNGLTNKGIAEKVGVPEKLVTERIRILDLPEEIQVMIREKREEFPLSCIKTLVQVAALHGPLATVCAEAVAGGRYSARDFAKDPVPLLAQFRASPSWPAYAIGNTYERKCFILSEDAHEAGLEADDLIGYEVGVRFNQDELDQALGAGVAIQGKDPGSGVILNSEFASELASKKLLAFVAELKAKKQDDQSDEGADDQQSISVSSRVYDPVAKSYTEDPERAKEIRKDEYQQRMAEQEKAHAFNMRLGTELVQKFDKIEPTLQVLKAIAYIGLDEAQDLAFRGMRYCYPAWVEEQKKTLKSGEVRTKIVYKDGPECRELVTKFLEGGRTADQYTGRLLILLLANRFADERAVARSNRGGGRPHGSHGALDNWQDLVANLDAIAKRKLSPTLYDEAQEVLKATSGYSYEYGQTNGHSSPGAIASREREHGAEESSDVNDDAAEEGAPEEE